MPGKTTKWSGTRWEDIYGYPQAVKVDDAIYVSGQLSIDQAGDLIAAAPLGDDGKIVDHSNMEAQMRQSYANAERVLAQFGATLADVVDETLFVTDMDKAFDAAGKVRREAYRTSRPEVASTIVVTPRLALPGQLVEIKFVARRP